MRTRIRFDGQSSLVNRCGRLVSATAAVLSHPLTTEACSVCGGSAIGTDPGSGFNASILFLLSMPYAVVGVIAGWLIYSYWRASDHRREKIPVHYMVSMEKEGEN